MWCHLLRVFSLLFLSFRFIWLSSSHFLISLCCPWFSVSILLQSFFVGKWIPFNLQIKADFHVETLDSGAAFLTFAQSGLRVLFSCDSDGNTKFLISVALETLWPWSSPSFVPAEGSDQEHLRLHDPEKAAEVYGGVATTWRNSDSFHHRAVRCSPRGFSPNTIQDTLPL